jgi:GTP-binding protein
VLILIFFQRKIIGMFYDEVKVSIKAGNGGDGCFSFRRAKYEPKGGPDGGNGGRGGSVILVGDTNVADLTDFYFKPILKAKNGETGRGSDQHGARGSNLMLKVPVGTVIINRETEEVVAEVVEHGAEVLLLEGGEGGKGNMQFKSSTNRAPREFTLGKPGGTGEFLFVIKTIADVGLVGFPNAGKSTLLNTLTNAHPKMASYPFTTLFPTVGILEYPELYERVTLADIPGLIEGASENKGLGHRFLKHIERCKVLLIMVDLQGTDNRDPVGDYRILLKELKLYLPKLLKKPMLIVGNKLDEPDAEANFKKLKAKVAKYGVTGISCLSEDGFDELKSKVFDLVMDVRKASAEETIDEDSYLG